MAADGSLTRHGFPRGYRFVPTDLELIYLLSEQIHRGELPPGLDGIFHNLRILDYHPEELYEVYKEEAEHRYIYFFSRREFQKKGAGGAAPGDKGQKKGAGGAAPGDKVQKKKGAGGAAPGDKDQKGPRLVRVARGGGWKATGGGQNLRWPRRKGGFFAGRKMTLVFYDGGVDKSNWGMHEFVVPVREFENLTSPPTHFKDLALYRLYIIRSSDMESENDGAGSSSQMLADASDDDHFSPSTAVAPCPPVQPWGVFEAGASTSQMPPPPQHRPSVEHAHYHHHQFAFGAASAGAATQQKANDMPVHGAGLPGDWCQFVSPPALAPVPPAAADQAAHRADTTVAPGAGQEAGHFVATPLPCSLPATGSPPAEQHATTTTEPAHAQSADWAKPEEEAPPPLEDVMPAAEDEADDYSGLGMPDWNLDFAPSDDDYSFQFTMEEMLGYPAFDEPTAMDGDSNSGGENCSSQASVTKQDPPSAFSCY